jgi:hypothetical protein
VRWVDVGLERVLREEGARSAKCCQLTPRSTRTRVTCRRMASIALRAPVTEHVRRHDKRTGEIEWNLFELVDAPVAQSDTKSKLNRSFL